MRTAMFVTALLHLALPIGLAAWLAFVQPASRLHGIAKLLLALAFVALLWIGGSGWHVVGTVFRPVVALAGATGAAASLRWWPQLDWWAGGIWPNGVATAAWFLIGGLLTFSCARLAAGLQRPSAEAVDMAFPLRGGDFYVIWGGSTTGMNRHLKVLEAEGGEQFRGQAYAHDIVELNWLGARANGLHSTDPTDYEIFGAEVVAPCAGEVLRSVDDKPDLDPPNRSDGPPAGNHVLLDCGDFHVALAHLKKGSTRVEPGDSVEAGTLLGRVGNSGNTTEPHLHVHAQRPGDSDTWMSGDPLVSTFDGEFLTKGTIVDR